MRHLEFHWKAKNKGQSPIWYIMLCDNIEPPRYNWNIVENGIKHHNPNPLKYIAMLIICA